MKILCKLKCFFIGHDCEETGRHGITLTELRCKRCDGLYISHKDYGNMLVPANDDSDRIFENRMKQEVKV